MLSKLLIVRAYIEPYNQRNQFALAAQVPDVQQAGRRCCGRYVSLATFEK